MLHVSKVYLNGLQFCDLKLVFDCGQVIDYSCSNFETEEENRKYIEDNILFHHPKLILSTRLLRLQRATFLKEHTTRL